MSVDTVWERGVPDNYAFGRYGDSPYNYPPDGLEILVSHDWAGDWEFEMIVVWKHKDTGELRAAYDSGCSCPTPFGDLTWEKMLPVSEVDDLEPLFHKVFHDAYPPKGEQTDPGRAEIRMKVARELSKKGRA